MAKFKSYTPDQGELIPMYFGNLVEEDHLARTIHDIVEQLGLSKITDKYTHQGEEGNDPPFIR